MLSRLSQLKTCALTGRYALFVFTLITLFLASCGGSDTKIPPTASFTQDLTTGEAPLTVQFTDTSEEGSAGITAWAWRFGDGAEASTPNPTHTYTAAGAYTVELSVETEDGEDVVTLSNLITVTEPPLVFDPTVLKLNIVDEDGALMDGAQASSSIFTIQEQSYNTNNQFLVEVEPSEDSGVVRIFGAVGHDKRVHCLSAAPCP